MDIKELEFIRDFADLIGNLNMDMTNLTMALDDADEDEVIKEVRIGDVNFAWSILHTIETMEKLFYSFKDKIDEKYHHVWREKHPQMVETYEQMRSNEKTKEGTRTLNASGRSSNKVLKEQC